MRINLKVITVVLLLATPLAYADDSGFFIGGSIGYSTLDVDDGDLVRELAAAGITATVNVDDEDMGWKIFGGYNINQYFGVEMGYADLGETSIDMNITAPVVGSGSGDVSVDGFAIAGVGSYPISDQVDVYAKIGAYFWNADLSIGGLSGNVDDDGTEVLFGLGAKYQFTEQVGVRAEWERYGADDVDVDLFSIGVVFEF